MFIKSEKTIFIFLLIIFYNFFVIYPHLYAQDWKKEYEDICSRTEDAVNISVEELISLVERCDKLKLVIEKLEDESTRKVYLKRLQMCRDLYQFCLEEKLLKK